MFSNKLLAAILAAFFALVGFAVEAQVATTGAGLGTPAVAPGTPMITPVLAKAASSGNPPATSGVTYGSIVGGEASSGFSATRLNRTVPFPIPGKFTRLKAFFPTVLSAGSYNVSLNINNADAGFTCVIDTTHQTCTDNVTNANITAGQLLAVQVTATSTPTSQAVPVQISLLFTSTNNNESFICSSPVANPSNAAQNWNAFGSVVGWSATEINVSSMFPVAGTLDQFYVAFSTAIATGSYTASLYQNGANSTVTKTISSGSSGSDLVDSINVAALDTVSLSSNPATTPTGSSMSACARWRPTVANQAVVFGGFTTVPPTTTNAIRFGNLSGAFANDTAQANPNNIITDFGTSFTLSNFVVAQSALTGAGATRAVDVLQGTPGGTINTACSFTTTLTNSATLTVGGVAATPAIQDNSTNCAMTAGNSVDIKLTNSATTPAAVTWFKHSAVAVVQ